MILFLLIFNQEIRSKTTRQVNEPNNNSKPGDNRFFHNQQDKSKKPRCRNNRAKPKSTAMKKFLFVKPRNGASGC